MTDKEQIKNNFEKVINVPTKQQTIIDGVDVKECDWLWLNTEKPYNSRCFKFKDVYSQCEDCKKYPNCYYKLLARKTQESSEVHKYYKELRTPATELADKNVKLNKQLKEKEQEYTQLKEDYKELEQRHNEVFQDFERIKQECEELKERLKTQIDLSIRYVPEKVLNRYRKALEEIEEYCNKERNSWCESHCNRTSGFCKERSCYPIRDLTYILGIISKAKGEENAR